MFTQPRMYQAISSHVPVLDQFVQKLIARGDIAADDVAEMQENIYQELERKFEASLSYSPGLSDWAAASHAPVVCETETGISRDLLLSIGKSISTLPSDLKPHRVLAQLYKFRRRMVETGRNIDWALAEQVSLQKSPPLLPVIWDYIRRSLLNWLCAAVSLWGWHTAGMGRNASRWPPRASVRAGCSTWHLLPSPRGASRPRAVRGQARAFGSSWRGRRAVHHFKFSPQRICCTWFRTGLQP